MKTKYGCGRKGVICMQQYEAKVLYDTGYVMRPFTISNILARSKEEAENQAKIKVFETLKNSRAAHSEYIRTHLLVDSVTVA